MPRLGTLTPSCVSTERVNDPEKGFANHQVKHLQVCSEAAEKIISAAFPQVPSGQASRGRSQTSSMASLNRPMCYLSPSPHSSGSPTPQSCSLNTHVPDLQICLSLKRENLRTSPGMQLHLLPVFNSFAQINPLSSTRV